MAIFKVNVLCKWLKFETNKYILLKNLFNFSQNNTKDNQEIIMIIFRIEIYIVLFITQLPINKLKKTIKVILNVFSQKTVSFINI